MVLGSWGSLPVVIGALGERDHCHSLLSGVTRAGSGDWQVVGSSFSGTACLLLSDSSGARSPCLPADLSGMLVLELARNSLSSGGGLRPRVSGAVRYLEEGQWDKHEGLVVTGHFL